MDRHHYDPSSGADGDDVETGDGEIDLRAMAAADAEVRALSRLGRIAEHVRHDRERERDEPLDPEVVARFEARCAADDAPLSYRSLARRVHEGALTWQDFWVDPRRHGAPALVADVARDLVERPLEPRRPPTT